MKTLRGGGGGKYFENNEFHAFDGPAGGENAKTNQKFHLVEALAAGNDRITLHGHVDPVKAMSDIDVLVMPSRWEAYGLVALEARAAGRPLLVSGVDGLADHVDRGATSVSGASVQAWKLALADIVTRTEPASAAQDRRQAAAAEAAGFAIAWAGLIAELLPPEQSPSDGLASDAALAV